jgi:hypothetical protein
MRSGRILFSLGSLYIESLFLQVANARRKAEAQQTAHGKEKIGEAAGVGVVLVDDKLLW